MQIADGRYLEDPQYLLDLGAVLREVPRVRCPAVLREVPRVRCPAVLREVPRVDVTQRTRDTLSSNSWHKQYTARILRSKG